MIILYRNKEVYSKCDSKLEFNKIVKSVAMVLENTTKTCAQKFKWDIHINDRAFEYPLNEEKPLIIWEATDDTGKWYRKDE